MYGFCIVGNGQSRVAHRQGPPGAVDGAGKTRLSQKQGRQGDQRKVVII
jgi:hypothetical protein